MAEQHSATQPGPQSTGVPDVAKAVDATDAAKAVVHEAHMVDTFGKTDPPELVAVRHGLVATRSENSVANGCEF